MILAPDTSTAKYPYTSTTPPCNRGTQHRALVVFFKFFSGGGRAFAGKVGHPGALAPAYSMNARPPTCGCLLALRALLPGAEAARRAKNRTSKARCIQVEPSNSSVPIAAFTFALRCSDLSSSPPISDAIDKNQPPFSESSLAGEPSSTNSPASITKIRS